MCFIFVLLFHSSHTSPQTLSHSFCLFLFLRVHFFTECLVLTFTSARVFARAPIDGPGSPPTDAEDHTPCAVRALMRILDLLPPHVCVIAWRLGCLAKLTHAARRGHVLGCAVCRQSAERSQGPGQQGCPVSLRIPLTRRPTRATFPSEAADLVLASEPPFPCRFATHVENPSVVTPPVSSTTRVVSKSRFDLHELTSYFPLIVALRAFFFWFPVWRSRRGLGSRRLCGRFWLLDGHYRLYYAESGPPRGDP